MAIEYFKRANWPSPRQRGTNAESFSYRMWAIGKRGEDGTYPTARIGGVHVPGHFEASFDPAVRSKWDYEPGGIADFTRGLNPYYLRHQASKITKAMGTRELTQDEKNAHEAISLTLNHMNRGDEIPTEKHAWVRHQMENNPHIVPTRLFEETQEPKTTVNRMFADPSMVSSAMVMAGMAYRDFGGATLEADESLSTHSSALVKNAIAKGLPVEASPWNPEANVLNSERLEPRRQSLVELNRNLEGAQRVHPTEVAQARQTIRELRGKTKRSSQPATDKGLGQQFLPGMEGFV